MSVTHTQSGASTVNSRLTRLGARIDGRPLTDLGIVAPHSLYLVAAHDAFYAMLSAYLACLS